MEIFRYNKAMGAANNTRGPVARWFEKKYIAWLSEVGEMRSLEDFAKHLGLKPATFNRYYNGLRKRIDYQTALQIANVLGDFEILDILNYQRPDAAALLSGFPPEFRDRFLAALAEARVELASKGMTEGSPEAERIIIEAFASHGLNISVTNRDG